MEPIKYPNPYTPADTTPLRRSATVQPIASIASAATGDKVDLLAVVASAQPPEPYEVKQGKNMGKKGRRINMVVCAHTVGTRRARSLELAHLELIKRRLANVHAGCRLAQNLLDLRA